MTTTFKPMTEDDIPLWLTWSYRPHVSDIWFREGDEPRNMIYEKVAGNGYDYPFIIYLNETPVGFIQCSDLDQYYLTHPVENAFFANRAKRSFSIDVFIAETDYLNQGYGTHIMRQFITKLFTEFDCHILCIDPDATNQRAIRCYEKAGFHFACIEPDSLGQGNSYIMTLTRPQKSSHEPG